jgi:hypothetical protein
MPPADVPGWCRWRAGTRALLLVAPHGGHADDTESRSFAAKVNDLHTAELTWRIAETLDAAAIVNHGLDRNHLDLNRISQVTRRAPWFLALIEALLADLLDRHPTVDVLFIHGWNVIQPKCDIGLGACLEDETAAAAHPHLTSGAATIARRLATLRALCAAEGVHTSYGERYPASHPNNLVQLFRQDGSRPCPAAPRICDWARHGRVSAVQLELGVPLRWEGSLRDGFTRALLRTFGDAPEPARLDVTPPQPTPPAATMLVAHDPRARLGLMSGVSMQPSGRLGARLLLFTHEQTMALFTGEDPPWRTCVIGGPEFVTRDGTTTLSFTGPLLQVGDAAAYLNLEHAFTQSRLVDARVTLAFRAAHGDSYGHVSGSVRIAGVVHDIDTFGFRNLPIFLRRAGTHDTRVALAAAFGADVGVHATFGDAGATGMMALDTTSGRDQREIAGHGACAVAGADTPHGVTLQSDRHVLSVQPLNRMRIRRPLANGCSEMIALGLGRFQLAERGDGYGFYEYARRDRPP